jgi:hypothetical protein
MVATLRNSIKIKGIVVPKGTTGVVIGVSNSKKIIEAYTEVEHKVSGWFYFVQFPDHEKTLLDRSQIDLN